MTENTTEQPSGDRAGFALSEMLDRARATANEKRHAATRDLARTVIAALTACGMAKGMVISAHSHDIVWSVAFALGVCFWAAGMWYWKELDG